MDSPADARSTAALRRAAVRATYAPSIHNSQPWRLVLRPGELSLYADPSRRLATLDPQSRQMILGCGSALMNARVSLAASGLGARVERLPDPLRPDLLAIITTTATQDMPFGFLMLDQVLELRETNGQRFADDPVPADVVASLEMAGAAEACTVFVVDRDEDRLSVADLVRTADALELADPVLRADQAARSPADAGRHCGVQERSQCVLVLGTAADGPIDWLRAGEALERILLEVTRLGFVASPLTEALDLASLRTDLRERLGLDTNPQMLLRVGRAPITPAARRRRLVDVLSEET